MVSIAHPGPDPNSHPNPVTQVLADCLPRAMYAVVQEDQLVVATAGVRLGDGHLDTLFDMPGLKFRCAEQRTRQAMTFRTVESVEPAEWGGSTPRSPTPNRGAHGALFRDVPLGARIVAAAAAGYRDRKFRLWSDPTDHSAGMLEVKQDVPSLDWVTLWERQKVIKPSHTLEASCVPLVALDARDPLLSSSPHGKSKKKSKSEKGEGASRVFGVASNMLEMKGGISRCEYVTMLPPGEAWMARALLTFGIEPPGSGGQWGLTPDQVLEAEAFSDACAEAGESLNYRPKLVEMITNLFGLDFRSSTFGRGSPAPTLDQLNGTASASPNLDLSVRSSPHHPLATTH